MADEYDESQAVRAALFETQRRVLEAFARGADLEDVLTELCLQVESWLDGDYRCSVMLVEDGHITDGVGPNLPPDYLLLLEGIDVGPAVGSCGTAVYRESR